MYFRVEANLHLAWNLVEMSVDETGRYQRMGCMMYVCPLVQRPLDPFEDPSRVVDFWGKNKVRFILNLTL